MLLLGQDSFLKLSVFIPLSSLKVMYVFDLVAKFSMLSLNGIFGHRMSLTHVLHEFYELLSCVSSHRYKAFYNFTSLCYIPKPDFLLHLFRFPLVFISISFFSDLPGFYLQQLYLNPIFPAESLYKVCSVPDESKPSIPTSLSEVSMKDSAGARAEVDRWSRK